MRAIASVFLLLPSLLLLPNTARAAPLATLESTASHTLRAADVDQTFRLQVALPHGYEPNGQRYPVVYLLDADLLFGLVTETARLLALDRMFVGRETMPPAIVVGVGYPGGLAEMTTRRARDLEPSADAQADGASAFASFLHRQVIPFVETHYRASAADRTLAGTSTGGLFVLDTLLRRPGTFQRYLAASPRPDDVLFAFEERYAATHDDLAAIVALSSGDQGEIEGFIAAGTERLHSQLAGREYPSLRLSHFRLPGDSHASAQPAAFSRGLREVYAAPAPASHDLVLLGQITELKPTADDGWQVAVTVDEVLAGSFEGTRFEFTVHSPARSRLEQGQRLRVEAQRKGEGYEVDGNQWSYPAADASN